MACEWILAIDQGTTNTKALLVDREGCTAYRASAPLEILQPQPGFVEQDPVALWQSVVQVISDCVRHAQSERACIAGIAITNQRETAVAWHRAAAGSSAAGKPVGNAITWQCRRSEPVCDRLREHSVTIQSISGLPLDPLLSATKWAWLFDRHPDLQAQAAQGELYLGTVDAWLLYNLTAGKVHAKAALVVRREEDGSVRRYLHLSTGNYNDRTARLAHWIGGGRIGLSAETVPLQARRPRAHEAHPRSRR